MASNDADDFIDADAFDPEVVAAIDDHMDDQQASANDAVRQMLGRRKQAYAAVFQPGERTQADINIVLNDLMWFCRVWQPTFDKRDGEHAATLSHIKEGRREVFQRIKDFSLLDSDALLLKYTDATTK